MRASHLLFGFTYMSDYIKHSAVTEQAGPKLEKNKLLYAKAKSQTSGGEINLFTNE